MMVYNFRIYIITQIKKFLRPKTGRSQRRGVFWTKILLGLLICILFAMAVFWDSIIFRSGGDISCFYQSGNLLVELGGEEEPISGSSIFFHETSCQKNCSDIHLKPRQACSLESALIAHPDKDIFLLVSSPVFAPLSDSRNLLVQELLGYNNFKVRHINFSKYLADTPMVAIERSGALNFSQWPVSHASDILRYATLYKYGGIYLDLDVMVLKSLGSLVNFAGAESNTSVGSGILGFGADAVGREVASECAEELASRPGGYLAIRLFSRYPPTFNGQVWGFNGPGVITRVLKRRCQTSSIGNMSKKSCRGFDVHPVESFAGVSFTDVEQLFSEDKNHKIPKLLNRSYTIHFWNKFSSRFLLENPVNVPFVNYAKIYCPKIFGIVNGSF